ncbi:MAG: 3-methylcrotonyl-CoA carboxylase, partial [Ktedonobacterales bacterium]|nr:3-methylcrotonyl-CoA carboxylase [Ktedonobacterales bacterium]
PRGHAIEVRLYAEDPNNGYLPSTGRLLAFDAPRAPGVRVDAGVATGDEVTVNYDPMLAKLIASGEDRDAAIQGLRWALDHFAVLGIATNIPLLRAIISDPDFQAGKTTTAFLEDHDLSTVARGAPTPPLVLLAAAVWEALSAASTLPMGGPVNPWQSGATALGGGERRSRYHAGDARHLVTLLPGEESGFFRASVDGAPYPDENPALFSARLQDATLTMDFGGQRQRYVIARRGFELLVWWQGQTYTLAKPRPLDVESAARGGEAHTGVQALVAPMAGTLIKVYVREGDEVAARQTLVVLGAMKMEHAIIAPYAGRVMRVAFVAGDVVPGGEVLVELDVGDGKSTKAAPHRAAKKE